MTSIPWNRINTGLLLFVLLGMIAMFASRTYGGPLDPLGPPGETDSVKLPGTPISSVPFVISQPGNYYLTRNLSMGTSGDGITIQASNVTVDLMGFELSPGVSLSAAFSQGAGSPARTSWTIRNGTIRDWPYNAVYAPLASGSVFEGLEIIASSGSTTAPTIYAGNDTIMRDVRFHINPANVAMTLGENARVSDCLIDATGPSVTAAAILGPNSSITACTIVGYSTGISGGAHNLVSDCVMKGQTYAAIIVGPGSSVTGCIVELVNQETVGIWSLFEGGSTIRRNAIHCSALVNRAIVAGGGDWIDENSINDCTIGVDAGTDPAVKFNAITRNRCRNTVICIFNGSFSDVGPEGPAQGSTSPWANIVD